MSKGSTFSCTVKLDIQLQHIAPNSSLAPVSKDLKTLIVDHSHTNREAIEEILNAWRINSTSVADGNQALEELNLAEEAGQPYRLVLLDDCIPGEGGFEIAGKMFNRGSASPRIIMLLNAHKLGQDAARCDQLN